MHSCGMPPPPAGAMLKEHPLYPWASSCFPGMLVQLKKQDHSNPMTWGSKSSSIRSSPGKPQTLGRGLSHGSFGVVLGERGTTFNNHLSLHVLSCSVLLPEHHSFIYSPICSRPYSCTHSLPSSPLQVAATPQSCLLTLDGMACIGFPERGKGRAQNNSGF
jgi:hypothetical protein